MARCSFWPPLPPLLFVPCQLGPGQSSSGCRQGCLRERWGLGSAGRAFPAPPAGRRAPETKGGSQERGRRYQKGQGRYGEMKAGRGQHLASPLLPWFLHLRSPEARASLHPPHPRCCLAQHQLLCLQVSKRRRFKGTDGLVTTAS